jgi:hypothetical protein
LWKGCIDNPQHLSASFISTSSQPAASRIWRGVPPCGKHGHHFPGNLPPGDEHPENPVLEYGELVFTVR